MIPGSGRSPGEGNGNVLQYSCLENPNNFVNREDVKTAVEKTKEGVVDVAEKALEILKGWLAPEREDK